MYPVHEVNLLGSHVVLAVILFYYGCTQLKSNRPVKFIVNIFVRPSKLHAVTVNIDRVCGLVARVPEVPVLISGTIKFSGKWWVWNRVHSAS
jgi:hypothetical protein